MSNPQQHSQIREAYRRNGGNLAKTARELGLTLSDVRQAFPPTLQQPAEDQAQPDFSTLGRPELRPFIISVRHAHSPWPNGDREIIRSARQKFDAGTHIMVQGRDGEWIIQYLWRRQHAVAPVNYFYGAF